MVCCSTSCDRHGWLGIKYKECESNALSCTFLNICSHFLSSCTMPLFLSAGARIALYCNVLHCTVAFTLFSAAPTVQLPTRLHSPLSSPPFFLLRCFTSTETERLIRDGEGGGGGGRIIPVLRPVKTEETVSHSQNNKVTAQGTPSVRSSLCISLIAVSTAEQRHYKVIVRKAAVEEQLSSKTIYPAMTAQLHLPAFDLSWTVSSKAIHPAMTAQLHLPAFDLSWTLSAARQSIRL